MDIRGAGLDDSDKIEDTYSVSSLLIFQFKSCTTQVSLPLPNLGFFRSAIGTLAKATHLAKKIQWELTCECGGSECFKELKLTSHGVASPDWEIKLDSPPKRGQPPPKE